MHIYIYLYVYIYMCVCIYVCVSNAITHLGSTWFNHREMGIERPQK
jgi:hypothetical protein